MKRDRSERTTPIILIANDQEWSARSLETILVTEGYEVQRAYTGRQALEKAMSVLPDLIILDYQLPDLTGADVCRQLRADPAFGAATPIFVTTAGSNGRPRQLEVLEAGAWEFFPQPFDGQIMLLKIRTHLAAKAAFERARRGMLVDPESGVYTAQGVAVRAREVGAEALRKRQGLVALVLAPADPVLAEAADLVDGAARDIGLVVRRLARLSDAVGRLRGLQFAIVASGADDEGARQMVARFKDALGPTTGLGSLRAGICAVAEPGDGGYDPLDLLRRAEEAMGRATKSEPVVVASTSGSPASA